MVTIVILVLVLLLVVVVVVVVVALPFPFPGDTKGLGPLKCPLGLDGGLPLLVRGLGPLEDVDQMLALQRRG